MIPERARAVVIGGGVIGCSILYHLAKLGWTDSVLVEQYQLTHGSTWHSAGLVGQLRSSISLTRMMQYSVGLYAELKELTGNDPGWHQLGGLRLASSQPRLEEIRRQAAWAKTFGLPMEIVSAEEAQALFPPMSTDGVLAAAFIPDDGYLDPSQLTFALADGLFAQFGQVFAADGIGEFYFLQGLPQRAVFYEQLEMHFSFALKFGDAFSKGLTVEADGAAQSLIIVKYRAKTKWQYGGALEAFTDHVRMLQQGFLPKLANRDILAHYYGKIAAGIAKSLGIANTF